MHWISILTSRLEEANTSVVVQRKLLFLGVFRDGKLGLNAFDRLLIPPVWDFPDVWHEERFAFDESKRRGAVLWVFLWSLKMHLDSWIVTGRRATAASGCGHDHRCPLVSPNSPLDMRNWQPLLCSYADMSALHLTPVTSRPGPVASHRPHWCRIPRLFHLNAFFFVCGGCQSCQYYPSRVCYPWGRS